MNAPLRAMTHDVYHLDGSGAAGSNRNMFLEGRTPNRQNRFATTFEQIGPNPLAEALHASHRSRAFKQPDASGHRINSWFRGNAMSRPRIMVHLEIKTKAPPAVAVVIDPVKRKENVDAFAFQDDRQPSHKLGLRPIHELRAQHAAYARFGYIDWQHPA